MKVGLLVRVNAGDDAYAAIADAANKGFDNGQLCIWDLELYTDETAEKINRACKDFGFTITALWCGWSGYREWSYPAMYNTLGLVPSDWRQRRTEDLLNGSVFACKIGVTDIVSHVGYLPDSPYHPDNIGVVKALKQICNVLKERGQRFLFETGQELPLTLAYLIRDVGADNLGVNFDPANLIMNGRGFCPAESLKFLAPYIRGVHAKDALMPVIPELKKTEVPAGQGDADFPRLIAILKEIGYEGSVTIENEKYVDPDREAKIMQSKRFLEELIGEKREVLP